MKWRTAGDESFTMLFPYLTFYLLSLWHSWLGKNGLDLPRWDSSDIDEIVKILLIAAAVVVIVIKKKVIKKKEEKADLQQADSQLTTLKDATRMRNYYIVHLTAIPILSLVAYSEGMDTSIFYAFILFGIALMGIAIWRLMVWQKRKRQLTSEQ